jgi:CO/xanthine dehydrogenase FAD-binding subunit
MKAFDLYEPESIEDACSLLEKFQGQAAILAGGTDLLVQIKAGLISLPIVVNLKKIPRLDYIAFEKNRGLRIGALATWTQILESEAVSNHYPILKMAAEAMASMQIRNIATLVGNVCHASPAANGPIPLMLYEAECQIRGPQGSRMVPIADIFKGVQKNSLAKAEIMVEIHLPPPPSHGGTYYKFATRKAMDLAFVAVGVLLDAVGGKFNIARIALGAVNPTPIRARKAEELLTGKNIEDPLIRKAAKIAADECTPISDIRASKEYRIELVRELTHRAIVKAVNKLY